MQFLDILQKRLRDNPLLASRICLEVAEKDFLREPTTIESFFRFLIDLGGQTAIDDFDIDAIVNSDGTVNLDGEGLAVAADGGIWVASEGRGNLTAGVSNPDDRPFESPNVLAKVMIDGDVAEIVDVVLPPIAVTENQLRFGYEGVTSAIHDGVEYVYVCHQRAWENAGDVDGQQARISRFNTTTEMWETVYYPLEAAESAAGGWVGLSESVVKEK